MHTWHDAVTAVLESVGGDTSSGRNLSQAKAAVQNSVPLLATERDWRCYVTPYRISTSASYTTGTIAYDHTGGASERLVTGTGTTFPSWTEDGQILINSIPYRIDKRLSDTTLTLTSDSNPGSDVAASTSFTIYRPSYTLPAGYEVALNQTLINRYNLHYQTPEQFALNTNTQEYVGQPRCWTVHPAERNPDRLAVVFYPAPDTIEQMELTVKRRPVRMSVYDSQTGTVSCSVGARGVTGVGTDWTDALVGAVIRFGTTSAVPESENAAENNFVHEARVASVESTTALTMEADALQTSSSVKHRISSLVDIQSGPMWSALTARARFEFGNLSGSPRSQVERAWAYYLETLKMAKASDQTYAGGDSRGFSGDWVQAALISPTMEW